jgi:hypothetical protein
MSTHCGKFITYWIGTGTEADPNRLAAVDFITSGLVADITGTPSAELYAPDPNACVCYVEGTLADLTALDADANHVTIWLEEKPNVPG